MMSYACILYIAFFFLAGFSELEHRCGMDWIGQTDMMSILFVGSLISRLYIAFGILGCSVTE
jgi:hypothetical protein